MARRRSNPAKPRREFRFERWFLFVVVTVLSVGMSITAVYLITEGQRRCDAINRANAGNRAAWAFMEETVKAEWATTPPTAAQRRTALAFFAGLQERLRPIDC